jgi:ATP-dependent Lhr-like helicase
MESVDLVLLVESPGSVARGLQRVGRAGHGVGLVSKGRIFPKHRADLLEAAVVAERMGVADIEALAVPQNPLDVLAQQIVAAVAMEDWPVPSLYQLCRRAANYKDLTKNAFDQVVDMLAGRYPSHDFYDLRPRILWDRETQTLKARPGSRLLSLLSGGTIPDRGTYGVFVAGQKSRVGELDEEMVYETIPGDVFTLGASSWRVEEITRDQVIVSPAPGEVGKLPFWKGDGPGRPTELGRALGRMITELDQASDADALAFLQKKARLDELAAKNLLAYVRDQREATGVVPSDRRLVIERSRDELGDQRVCLLSPFGARVHAPWAIAIRARFANERGLDIETMAEDDGIVFRFAGENFDSDFLLPDPDSLDELLWSHLSSSPLFAAQFRENAARALLLGRRRPDARTPLWLLRKKAQDLFTVARDFPAFPITLETHRSCLNDIFDVPALKSLLYSIRDGTVEVATVDTPTPSPFSRSLVFAYVAAYLYEGDVPGAEKALQTLTLDKNL